MHRKRETHFVSVLSCLLILLKISLGIGNQNTSTVSERPKIQVELLIVCDKDFSDIFYQNRQATLEFWAANFWDVNMRFKTLRSVDISFHLSSLITTSVRNVPIYTYDAQPFIENARMPNGSIDLQNVTSNFGEMIHHNGKWLPNFDIAILITGAGVPNDTYPTSQLYNSVCKKDEDKGVHLSVATIHADFNFVKKCNMLERMLARILGAYWDSDMDVFRECRRKNHVMGNPDECDENQFFFSECTDMAIAFNLRRNSSGCLWNTSEPVVDILENITRTAQPLSLQLQCAILTNNSKAIVSQDGNQCISTKCYYSDDATRTFTKTLYPLDNSPCGNGKFCFRGRCLDQSYAISNVKSGACLHSSDRFGSDDYLIMESCIPSPTPLDKFIVVNKGNGVIHLATPYSTRNANENTDKCLSVEIDTNRLRYSKCLSECQEMLDWHLVQADNEGEFLLYHRLTKLCAYADENNILSVDISCFGSDSIFVWKFVDLPNVPDEWMKTGDVFTKNYNSTKSTAVSNATNHKNLQSTQTVHANDSSLLSGWIVSCIVILSGIMIGFLIGFAVSHFFLPETNIHHKCGEFKLRKSVLCCIHFLSLPTKLSCDNLLC